jgi:hypothetical protein
MLHQFVIDGVIERCLQEYSGTSVPGVFKVFQLVCRVITDGTDEQHETNTARADGRYPHQELGVAESHLLPSIAGILRKLAA